MKKFWLKLCPRDRLSGLTSDNFTQGLSASGVDLSSPEQGDGFYFKNDKATILSQCQGIKALIFCQQQPFDQTVLLVVTCQYWLSLS
ncbi:hypothetical protein L8106_05096 [Lyngbya sp. PCC 8106]|nr:hypothetical protein L8106_05096 [Lyngbya sp. PCC 8106]